MMFGRSPKRDLRDLIVALEAHWKKLYHLGMGKSVTSNLARQTSEETTRSSRICLPPGCEARSNAETIFGFKGNVYAFDSTTIDLCLELFHWAKFKHRGGISSMSCMMLKHRFRVLSRDTGRRK